MRRFFFALILLALAWVPPAAKPANPLEAIVRPYAFDIPNWEVRSLLDKAYSGVKNRLTGAPKEEDAFVLGYFSDAERVRALKAKAPELAEQDPQLYQSELVKLDSLRQDLKQREGEVEDIVARQLASVLQEEGLDTSFDFFGRRSFLWPPVSFQLDELPNVLIISPRDKIQLRKTYLLTSPLTPQEIEDVEHRVEELGYSALVETIGGLATYPSLIPQDTTLDFLLGTVAHEWLHQYFFFLPLGRNYWANEQMTTINETAADIAGSEIAAKLKERFYPAKKQKAQASPAPLPTSRHTFDFGREMRETRVAVEEYLRRGDVAGAESYMKERRDFLASNGYFIRRLNQAYFAFHGTYADGPAGAVSPIGGRLKELRRQKGSLGDFIKAVATISRYDDLAKLLDKG